jgi:glycosyltransferase involved in cell wall biosynthesis
MTPIPISLIIPTYGEAKEIHTLLDSLCSQTNQNFEVIIVDQNEDDHLIPIINHYQNKLTITHVKDPKKGVSRARNFGVPYCSGEILLWPDDDCWYPKTLIESIIRIYQDYPNTDGMVGLLIDRETHRPSKWFPRRTKKMSLLDAFRFGFEPLISFKKDAFETNGGYDEVVGIGSSSEWGAGEGTDIFIRAIKSQQLILITPDYSVYHPVEKSDPFNPNKTRSYSRGMGAVIAKNQLHLPFQIRYLLIIIRSILWGLIRFNFKEVRFHAIRLSSIIYGIHNYPTSK